MIDAGGGVNAITNKTKAIISGSNAEFITYENLEPTFNNMKKFYKEPVILKMIEAVQKGTLIPFYVVNKAQGLPTCLPFVKYKKGGVSRVAVDLSNDLKVTKDPDSGYKTYSIDTRKLYVRLLAAFLSLDVFGPNYILHPQALEIAAKMWARMYCKVLNRTIALNTSKERYEAFMYFCIRFFLSYIMECTDKVVDDISSNYLSHGKTYLINSMEATISEKGLEPYKDFMSFCTTMFNNEVSNLKGVRTSNVSESISHSFFIKEFIKMYDYSSVFALAAFPYFLFVIIATNNMARIMSDAAFEDVTMVDNKEYVKLLNTILSEV